MKRNKSFVKKCGACSKYKRISFGDYCKTCLKDPLMKQLAHEENLKRHYFPPKKVINYKDPDADAVILFVIFSAFVIWAFSFKVLLLYLAVAFLLTGLVLVFKKVFNK